MSITVYSSNQSMIQIQINLPESAFSILRSTPDEFAQELLIAAVVKWYEVGMISQSKAAEIAGISRQAFLQALDRFGVSPFQTTLEELTEEVSRG
jgi:predicted HTH domain antitoxin